jgi:hypothetical protein
MHILFDITRENYNQIYIYLCTAAYISLVFDILFFSFTSFLIAVIEVLVNTTVDTAGNVQYLK